MKTKIFELKKEHILLLKHLSWSINEANIINAVGLDNDGTLPPFGDNNLYEAIDLILNGKPSDFNPLDKDTYTEYTDEQKAEWSKLYSELPIALDVILYNGNFELGEYKTRWYLRDWIKIK